MKKIFKLFRASIRKSNQSQKSRGSRRRFLGSETLEKRQVLANDVLVAHNYFIAEDVNRDFKVTAADALAVINQIARNGGSQNLVGMNRGDLPRFFDVTADNKITPLDALRVINTMSRGGEGLGPNDEVVEYILTPRTTTDAEFGPDKFNPATRVLNVEVDEPFFIEVGYNDLRNSRDGDTGIFQIVADVVAGSDGTIVPVLTETQILQVDDGYLDATSGNLNFTRTGVAGTPFTVAATDFAAGPIPTLRTAISTLYGLTSSQFTVVSLGSNTVTSTVNGAPVTRSVVEFRIRFTDFALADDDIADLAVAGNLQGAGNQAITIASTNISTEPRLPDGSINPAAIRDNINFQSRTFNNQAFYGLPVGSFNPANGAVTGGGVGPITTSGIPDIIEEPFDAFSIPFRATRATPAGGTRVQVAVTPPSADPNVDNTVLRFSLRLAAGRLAQPLPAQASATTVFLDSVSGFRPLPGETTFLIEIDSEVMLVTAVNAVNNTFTVVRGQNGTAIASHDVPPPAVPGNQNFNVFSFEDEEIPADKILIDLGTNPAIDTDGRGFVTVVAGGGTVNTPPTITNITDRTVANGTSTGAVAFTVNDAETPVANLTVTGSSSNTALVPNANIVFGGTGANRTVTVTPVAGQSGTATITVTVNDGTATATDTFVLTVNAATGNTAPTITDIANQTVTQGTATSALAFTVGDAQTAAASLTVTGSSSNTTLVPNANIVFGGSGANRTVTVTPAAGQTGTATITVTVSDGSLSTSDTFILTVNAPANTAPTISNITDRSVTVGTSTGAIGFTVGDAQTAAASLTVTGSSSNTTLVPNANIVFGGSGANRTVTVTPAAGQVGTATITVRVSDGALSTTDTFVLTVNAAANTAPTISNIADRSVTIGTSTGAVAFTIGDAQTAPASLTVSGSSSNTTLVPNANIVLGGSGANRTITVTPAAGQVGTATITVTVSDGTLTASDTFVLTVTPAANTAPTISNIANVTINEDGATSAIAFTVGDSQTAVGSLVVSGTSSNTTLVPNANIVFGGSGANRTVTVTPVANRSGSATITLTVSDGSLTATDTFVVTVNSVNDAPVGAAVSRSVATGAPYTFSAADFPLTDPLDTPANTLAAVVFTTIPDAAQGTLRLAGVPVTAGQTINVAQLPTLTFTSAANFTGNSTFTFRVRDNGGGDNGGVSTDPTPRVFTFNVRQFDVSTISGKVFIDFLRNDPTPVRDGDHDPDEPVIGGVEVRLTSAASANVSGSAVSISRFTDGEGNYAFTGLVPGTYNVKFMSPDSLIQGGLSLGNGNTTAVSSTEFRIVIGPAGGVSSSGNNFTPLGRAPGATDTLDILVLRRSASTTTDSAFAVLNASGEQEHFELGAGYEDIKFAEIALNDARDAALLTVLDDDDTVTTMRLTKNQFAVSSTGKVVRVLGSPEDFAVVTTPQNVLESEFGDYRDAVDAAHAAS